jgi:hypothetical protein
MPPPEILVFAGRKSSGKTELARACVHHGYTLINFADSLKSLVCNCLDITSDYLERHKEIVENDNPYRLAHKLHYISREIGVERSRLAPLMTPFNTIREILQVLGTDIIRKYNPDWHVKRTVAKMKRFPPGTRFCIGDCRFLNEKRALEKLGAECWYVIRPSVLDVSNHISERELDWTQFDGRVIINDSTRNTLLKRWETYLTAITQTQDNIATNRQALYQMLSLHHQSTVSEKLGLSNRDLDVLCDKLLIKKETGSHYDYHYRYAFMTPSNQVAYIAGVLQSAGVWSRSKNGTTRCTLTSNERHTVEFFRKVLRSNTPVVTCKSGNKRRPIYSFVCDDPYLLENMKLWRLEKNTTLPSIIAHNVTLIKYWIVGLIDGAGDILLTTKSLKIVLNNIEHTLATYLIDKLGLGVYDKHKNRLVFGDNEALHFSDWLGKANDIGISKKWLLVTIYRLVKGA